MKAFFTSVSVALLFCIFSYDTAIGQVTVTNFRKIVENKLAKEFRIKTIENGKVVEKEVVFSDVCPVDTDRSAHRIFLEYGALYLAEGGVRLPSKCIFANEDQVTIFHSGVDARTENLDGTMVTLQRQAMDALLRAREKAARAHLKISPRGGSTASKRTYDDTRRLWDSRFLPGLAHWVRKGRLKQSDADAAKAMSTEDQVSQVLEWEDTRSLFFSKDLSKSILYSVAAPGASQHISMLALDVTQFSDKRVRALLAEEGWFQTVKSDAPHFTYLGLKEADLPSRGLKKVTVGSQDFWIPDFQ